MRIHLRCYCIVRSFGSSFEVSSCIETSIPQG
ncbi:unnamed protein product [Spirodela intermedia]|uniref:Uncharacterized protein n=1 Tax=Spirodela intermedia TaxID=51605 RepID=A0A7I8L7G5_SPIIN|nr:unnamed protein product [Spirodela intermedia]